MVLLLVVFLDYKLMNKSTVGLRGFHYLYLCLTVLPDPALGPEPPALGERPPAPTVVALAGADG